MRPSGAWFQFWRGLRLALLAIAAGGAALAPAEELVVAVARLPLSLPFYVAEEQGYFVDEGLKLRIEDCIVGRVCLKRMLDGEVPIATVADASLVLGSFSGKPFSILATFSSAANDNKMLARRSAGIAAPKDLIGKRIGTINGTGAQYFLDSFLLFNGIERRDIKVVNVPADRAAAAIQNREVDALALFEPAMHAAVTALGDDGKILPSARISRTNFNLAIDRKIAGPRDVELGKMLGALARANRFIREQPLRAQALLRSRLKLDQNFIDWIWKDYSYELTLDQSLVAVLESQARWALREGYAGGATAPNYLDYMHTAPLARLLPASVTIIK